MRHFFDQPPLSPYPTTADRFPGNDGDCIDCSADDDCDDQRAVGDLENDNENDDDL